MAAAAVLLGAREARAAPDAPRAAMRIEVVRGPGAERCPGDAFLRAEVARRLGADPFQDDAPLVLAVRIAQEGPELTALLALRDREGDTRWADGFGTRSGCEELLSGVALAIVARVLSAPETASSQPEPSSPPSAPSPPEPSSPLKPSSPFSSLPSPPPPQAQRAPPEPPRPAGLPQGSSRPEAAPAPPERLRLEAGLGATLGLGITPGAAAGMTLAVGIRRSEWSVAVEGRGLVSLEQAVKGMFVDPTAFTAATVGCYRGRLLFGCGLATLGAVRFTPRTPWTMGSRSDTILSFGGRLGAEWPLSSGWSVLGYAEATWIVNDAVLRRGAYDTATPAPLEWTSPPIGTAFGLGITAAY
ncbi:MULTISPECIES: hypothetical protein [Sorangium]|nr:hypothetical protein [Sorangium cellulosum]